MEGAVSENSSGLEISSSQELVPAIQEEDEEERHRRLVALDILSRHYGIDGCEVSLLSTGLINRTYSVNVMNSRSPSYIFQEINSFVFNEPIIIDQNIRMLADWLRSKHPPLASKFIAPLRTRANTTLVCQGGFYRVFPYINKSYTITKVESANQCFVAAKSFGHQTFMFKDFAVGALNSTILDFHNLTAIFRDYDKVLVDGDKDRRAECCGLISEISSYRYIVDRYKEFASSNLAKLRVTHHDTKISNVLFDSEAHDVATVIDLDTTFAGYFLSDVGDMFRSYVSSCDEDDENYDNIFVDPIRIIAIRDGYLVYMNALLTDYEKTFLYFSGEFMIYMQCIRFLKDYLNNDKYYSIKYAKHNYVRARNQMTLLKRFVDAVKILESKG